MRVVFSMMAPKSKIVYHKGNCIYAGRISPFNRKTKDIADVERKIKYCQCKYCGGFVGEIKVNHKYIERLQNNSGIKTNYETLTETFYIQTDIGFWKIFYKKDLGKYILYHRNYYSDIYSQKTLMYGEFHRQGDVKPADSIVPLLDYVVAHDKAKRTIADDYRKLPNKTKKQKKYYRMAEKKAHRQEARRLDFLFAKIENERRIKEMDMARTN